MLNSYGSIYALGHKAVADILMGDVEVTEKVDGSQLSWGVLDGELFIKSKNNRLHVGADNGMFSRAVEVIEDMAGSLQSNWVYRGEYLMRPKHNTIAYDRVPQNHIMIFDIEAGAGSEDYLLWEDRGREASRIGFEPVPTFVVGRTDLNMIKDLLETRSVLGGSKVEGLVVKNYKLFIDDKKVAKAKFVAPEFQEKNMKEWKKSNPGRQDLVIELVEEYRTEARWQKAVQHLREDGQLEGSPRDIGALMKMAQQDLMEEEADAIKDALFKHFASQISRGSVRGLADWYKLQLADGNIEGS